MRLKEINLRTPAAVEERIVVGQRALLLARPESIDVHTALPADSPALAGQVRRTSYLGSQVEYDVAVEGTLVTAILHDPGEQDLIAPGSAVFLTFLEQNLFLLPEEAPAGGESSGIVR